MSDAPQSTNHLVYSLVLIWIITRMVLLYTGYSEWSMNVGSLMSMLFVLIIAALTLWKRYRHIRPSDTNMLEDVKTAMQKVGRYALIIGGFVALYHFVIDPDLIERHVQSRLSEFNGKIEQAGGYEEFRTANGIDETISYEDAYSAFETKVRASGNPFLLVGGTLLSLIIWGSFCSLVSSVLMRGVFLR